MLLFENNYFSSSLLIEQNETISCQDPLEYRNSLSFGDMGSELTKFMSSESIWFCSEGTELTRFTDGIIELSISMHFLKYFDMTLLFLRVPLCNLQHLTFCTQYKDHNS